MKTADIRNLSTTEIASRLNDAREELMKFRFQVVSGGLRDHSRLRIARRNIARLATILAERQRAESQEGEA